MLDLQPLRGKNENLSYLSATKKMPSRWQMFDEGNGKKKETSSQAQNA